MCVIGELRKSGNVVIIVDEDRNYNIVKGIIVDGDGNYNYSKRIVDCDIYLIRLLIDT
jgi:hypothetical protein